MEIVYAYMYRVGQVDYRYMDVRQDVWQFSPIRLVRDLTWWLKEDSRTKAAIHLITPYVTNTQQDPLLATNRKQGISKQQRHQSRLRFQWLEFDEL